MSRLVVTDAACSFGPVRALDGTNLSVAPGQVAAVLGPSGCGKTTLLRAIAGLVALDRGSVQLGDRVVAGPRSGLPPERRGVGLVPQEGALFPHLDVAANIGFGLRGWPRERRRARVAELLSLVELPELGKRSPAELSGGQQQRVALARALAPNPGVLLLDEPFSSLDASLRAELRVEVGRLLRELGTTALLVTHDQAEALTMADSVAVMRAGRVVQQGTPREVYACPVDPWTARFVGEAVFLAGRRSDGVVHTALGELPLAPGEQAAGPDVTVLVRPQQIVRRAGGVPARVVSVEFAGAEGSVELACGDDVFTACWPTHELPVPGEDVFVGLAGHAMAYPGAASAG